LLFRHEEHVSGYDNYHGHEYCYIGYNELTKRASADFYEMMKSTNRCSFDPEHDTPRNQDGTYATHNNLPLPYPPLEIFSTTNPSGVGKAWVKRKFIDVAPIGSVHRTSREIFNPRTQKDEIITRTQVAIFGSYKENIYLPPEYVAELDSITDPNLRKAWLYGSWDAVSGGMFDDLWKSRVHVLPKFNIPSSWYVDRAFDWGSSHPFSIGWFAESNGEDFTLPDGSTFNLPRGSVIQIAEDYGTKEIGTNTGLKLSAADICKRINTMESKMIADGFIQSKPLAGPADNQITQTVQSDVETIARKMEDCGIYWTKSDKSAGSRVNGVQLFRDRLECSLRKESRGVYFMNTCPNSIEILPNLPRDEKKIDDVDTLAEDHIWDMVRYRILSAQNRIATNINTEMGYY